MWLLNIPGYQSIFNSSGRAGYGGTAWYYKHGSLLRDVSKTSGRQKLDDEGRTICGQVGKTEILGFYVPNGNRNPERLNYKLEFCQEISAWAKQLMADGHSVIIGGDLNIAHKEIDLFAPRFNKTHSGFLPVECQWFTDLLSLGMVDTFRHFESGPGNYTWWHYRDSKRTANNGWRFDYFLVSNDLLPKVRSSIIRRDVFGSDHAPIMLDLEI